MASHWPWLLTYASPVAASAAMYPFGAFAGKLAIVA